jgi:hypothetical protein
VAASLLRLTTLTRLDFSSEGQDIGSAGHALSFSLVLPHLRALRHLVMNQLVASASAANAIAAALPALAALTWLEAATAMLTEPLVAGFTSLGRCASGSAHQRAGPAHVSRRLPCYRSWHSLCTPVTLRVAACVPQVLLCNQAS